MVLARGMDIVTAMVLGWPNRGARGGEVVDAHVERQLGFCYKRQLPVECRQLVQWREDQKLGPRVTSKRMRPEDIACLRTLPFRTAKGVHGSRIH